MEGYLIRRKITKLLTGCAIFDIRLIIKNLRLQSYLTLFFYKTHARLIIQSYTNMYRSKKWKKQ